MQTVDSFVSMKGCGRREHHGQGSAKGDHEDDCNAAVNPGGSALQSQCDVEEVAGPEGCRYPGEMLDPV